MKAGAGAKRRYVGSRLDAGRGRGDLHQAESAFTMSPCPEILYKYCSPDRLEPLRDHALRVSQFNQLNDPLECMPAMEGGDLRKTWEDAIYRRFLEEGGKGNRFGRRFRSFFRKHKSIFPVWEEVWSRPDGLGNHMASVHLQTHMSAAFGVVCLSEVPTSSLMWSHYAHDHTGYVLGIRPTGLEDHVRKKGGTCGPVQYVSERKVMVHQGEFDESNFYYKSADWSYEHEWRFVFPLSHATKVRDGLYVRDYGERNQVEIILGYRSVPELREIVRQLETDKPWIKVRYARPSARHFNLEISDIPPSSSFNESVKQIIASVKTRRQ